MASTPQPVTHNLRIWCYHGSEGTKANKVVLLSFFYHRFDREVYDAMATCRGKVEGDKLNGVDPNMIKPADGESRSSSVTVMPGLLTILSIMLMLV